VHELIVNFNAEIFDPGHVRLFVQSIGGITPVPRVRNLGFVLNERLTATDHLRKVYQRIIFSFCRMPTMVILCLLVLIPHRRGAAYI
jgi:hypothetical protein